MTHDSQKLVMWCCFVKREWGTSTAPLVKDFCWPTEDVTLDLWWRIFSFGCPIRRIPFFAPEWESVNGIWRVRRSIEQVVHSFVTWNGEYWSGFSLSFGYLWEGWHSVCGNHLFSAYFVRELSPALFLSSSFFLSLSHSQHLASCCL